MPATASRQTTEVAAIGAEGWRRACAAEIGAGGRFCGAYAAPGRASGGVAWRAMFARGAATRVLTTAAGDGELESVVDLIAAADWDEREARETAGLRFAGREPMRPLIRHGGPTSEWAVPVGGRGVHQVAVGPVHAGIIESGHFRFHAVGERILHLDPRLFHKRRGLERAALGLEGPAALPLAQRACGACAVTHAVAFAQACEAVLGFAPGREIGRARTVLLELERLYNHLNDVGAICAGVGFATGSMAFAALKERALRLNAELAGHRFLFGCVAVGSSPLELPADRADRLRGALRELAADAEVAWREVHFSASVGARLAGVGVLSREAAGRLGSVGPAARAAGIREDARAFSPGLCYESGFPIAAPPGGAGDVAARLEVRPLEWRASLALLDELLAAPLAPEAAVAGSPGGSLGIARVESPRGESVCAVELERGRLVALHLRSGSYANWPGVAAASSGELLGDFPLINKSFELCYACVDR